MSLADLSICHGHVVRECEYLDLKGLDAYDGGGCHHAPLLLLLLRLIPKTLVPLVFILLDYYMANILSRLALVRLEEQKQEEWPEPTVVKGTTNEHEAFQVSAAALKQNPTKPSLVLVDPSLVEIVYLLNPLTILSCVAQSTALVVNASVITAVYLATQKKMAGSMTFAAVSTYFGLYPIVLLPPCWLLLSKDLKPSLNLYKISLRGSILFIAALGTLFGLSYQYLQSWKFLWTTYGAQVSISILRPNIGLFWYFAVEVFESFRVFFMSLFQFLIFIFIIPISFNISKMNVKDATSTFLISSVILYAAALGPLFYNLWIYASSGNANFFYAITLLWGLSQVMLLMDVASGFARREWERINPGWRISRVEAVLK